jgi:hypothetical protein
MLTEDKMTTEAIEALADRPAREGTDTLNGYVTVWSKGDFLDFTGWAEETYSNKPMSQRNKSLGAQGIFLNDIEGKGDNIKYHVTITQHAWHYMILRGHRRSNVVDAYLEDLFSDIKRLNICGVDIAATLDEFAQKYAQRFNVTPISARKKIDRVREKLNDLDYTLNGKEVEPECAQFRAKLKGESGYVQGLRAIELHGKIKDAFSNFFRELEKKMPIMHDDTKVAKNQKVFARKVKTTEFVNALKEGFGLSYIRKHYMGTLSNRAFLDIEAIQRLYMAGATFQEIKSFLNERPAYWEEQHQSNKPSLKSMEDLLSEII